MGSLGKRMMLQVQERFDFLSGKGPLSVWRQTLPSQFDDDDPQDVIELKDPASRAPQLSCDFFLKFGIEYKGGEVLESIDYSNSPFDSGNWVLSEAAVNPAKLSWGYHSQVIGFPTPTVSGDTVRLTYYFPASWSGDTTRIAFADYFTSLMHLYERQFSKTTGVLAMPVGDKVVLKVGLEVLDVGLRWDEEYRRVPLFDLVGIKFSSPQFLIDPNSNNPMGVSMDMVYSQTRWADLSQVVKKIEQLSLPDVDIREDQYWNR